MLTEVISEPPGDRQPATSSSDSKAGGASILQANVIDQKEPESTETDSSKSQLPDREHFIPIGRAELIDSLPGISSCSQEDQGQLRELFRVLDAFVHHQYHGQYCDIQKLYQPLDPDSEFKFSGLTVDSCNRNSKHVFSRLQFLLERANYGKLSQEQLELAVENASVLGIRLKVNLDLFEDLHIYARGNRVETWTKRTWWKFFRKEQFDVDVYQRLVIAFRLREHRLLSEDQATDVIYMKSFKSIPHSDMHALLPGTQVKMSLVDQGKIILPTLSGLAFNLFKLFRFLMLITVFATIFSMLQFTGLLIGIGLYVAKGIYSYIQTKDKHLLNLTRHLYFQNLDNNSGVLLRVLSEAESQDLREMVFAYYILWRFGKDKGLLQAELDEIAETNLRKTTKLEIDFEVEDALRKLEALQVILKKGDRWHAIEIRKALGNLDFRWDNVFSYDWVPQQENKRK